MSDKTTDADNDEDLDVEDNDNDNSNKDSTGTLSKEHQDLVEKIVAERLKGMKQNMDKTHKTLAELTKENTRLKEESSAKERKRLESEGKQAEADKLRIVELEEKLSIREKEILGYTRDREVEKAVSSLPFRNDYAKEVALKDIISDLVQDDDGAWVHKSGASLTDYIKAFAKDPNREILFKPKENNGTGTQPKGSAVSPKPKTLAGLSNEELLKAAAAGQLGSAFSF